MHKNVAISWSIEFGPIVSFFVALHFLGSNDSGFIISTAIFTVFTGLALVASYYYEGRIAIFPLVAGISVVGFGVITILSKNPLVFILKDTFYNGFFAVLLLFGAYMRKPMLKPLFKSLFDIKDKGWLILSTRWGLFFLLLTIGNEVSWRVYGQHAWVMYKFWSTIITTIFGFYQITLSKKYRNESATIWGMRKDLLKEK
jgi:intracellular septation protein